MPYEKSNKQIQDAKIETGFKMKGHTLPGIKQRPNQNLTDGRSASSAFQQSDSPMKLNPIPVIMGGVKAYRWGRKLQKAVKARKKIKKGLDIAKNVKNIKSVPAVRATTQKIAKTKGVKKIWSKIKKPLGTALWVGTGVEIGKGSEKRKQKTTGIEDKMKTTTPPSTPKNGGSKVGGKKTYKQAYSDPKVTAKYKDKGGYKQFVKESEAWWKTAAGQKYAKKHKKFAHRIKK